MRSPRNIPARFNPHRPLKGIGDQEIIQLAAVQSSGPSSVQDVCLELTLNHRGGKSRWFALPITSYDKRSSQMMQEGHQMTEYESIGVGLKSLPGFEINLDEKEKETISLKAYGHPSIALVKVLRRLVGQVLGGVQGQETSRSASLARRMSRLTIGLPSSVGVVLKSPPGSRLPHVGLVEHQQSVIARPGPVLYLGPELGNIAVEDGEGFHCLPGLLGRWQVAQCSQLECPPPGCPAVL